MELNRIKLLLHGLALSHGLTDADLHAYNHTTDDFEWHIDWKKNLTETFESKTKRLKAAINLYDDAMAKGDLLTARAGLVRAGIQLQSLASFFDGMTHDVKKAYGEPHFNWPVFPDGNWKIPPEYDFKS
ncbi:hypothetical protein G3N58_13505 [Paraburkholderia sp. Ac-20342]|uniref:hypothetical protein n=1 Tax=Paraburkholderia sp. Ac-20342 TaxID=2703889 RepID=UPI00197EA605|nr:hypothetical protein [Paraburkholderia sp. Ac-20342]MBN3847837.1 hypothetical protein [Paraburkholderia sp. Ac-20342]